MHIRTPSKFLVGAALLAHCRAQVFPLCATACGEAATAGEDGCGADDDACYCNSAAGQDFVNCVRGDCSATDFQQFAGWAEQQCALLGFPYTSSGSAPSATSFVTVTSSAPQRTTTVNAGVGTPAATPAAASSSHGVNPGVIAGPVVGGVVLIAAVVAGVIFWRRRKRQPVPVAGGAAPSHGGTASSDMMSASTGPEGAATFDERTSEFASGVDSAPVSSEKRPEVRQEEIDEAEQRERIF